MRDAATYCLTGQGDLDPRWIKSLLALFRGQSVNIRKLVLLKTERSDVFGLLEVVFALPTADPDEAQRFLRSVEALLALQHWQNHTLQSL